MSDDGPLSETAIAALLADVARGWDPRAADSLAAHGRETLPRHEARRSADTLALLDGRHAPGRVLEIGTGYLTLAATLHRALPFARLVGVEHPGRRYVWTREYQAALRVHGTALVAADIERRLPFADGAFDTVVFAEVVEHLPPNAVPRVLAELARVLRVGGALVLTTPNLAAWTNRELVMRGHSPQQPPVDIDGTHPHLRLYTMAELVDLLTAAGFEVPVRAFHDRVPVGVSPVRRALSAALAPARRFWPALRDTCAVRAERRAAGDAR